MMLARTADNLYWTSRYLGRVEHMAQMLMVQSTKVLDAPQEEIARGWKRLFDACGTPPPSDAGMAADGDGDADLFLMSDAYVLSDMLTTDPAHSNSILFNWIRARETARQVRARISHEMWSCLSREFLRLRSASFPAVWKGHPVAFYQSVVEAVRLFYGVADTSMDRGDAWQFLRLGLLMERILSVAPLIRVMCEEADQPDWTELLRLAAARELYNRRFTVEVNPDHVIDLLIYDPHVPCSLRFAVEGITESLASIDPTGARYPPRHVHGLAGEIKALLSFRRQEVRSPGDAAGLANLVVERSRTLHGALQQRFVLTHQPAEAL